MNDERRQEADRANSPWVTGGADGSMRRQELLILQSEGEIESKPRRRDTCNDNGDYDSDDDDDDDDDDSNSDDEHEEKDDDTTCTGSTSTAEVVAEEVDEEQEDQEEHQVREVIQEDQKLIKNHTALMRTVVTMFHHAKECMDVASTSCNDNEVRRAQERHGNLLEDLFDHYVQVANVPNIKQLLSQVFVDLNVDVPKKQMEDDDIKRMFQQMIREKKKKRAEEEHEEDEVMTKSTSKAAGRERGGRKDSTKKTKSKIKGKKKSKSKSKIKSKSNATPSGGVCGGGGGSSGSKRSKRRPVEDDEECSSRNSDDDDSDVDVDVDVDDNDKKDKKDKNDKKEEASEEETLDDDDEEEDGDDGDDKKPAAATPASDDDANPNSHARPSETNSNDEQGSREVVQPPSKKPRNETANLRKLLLSAKEKRSDEITLYLQRQETAKTRVENEKREIAKSRSINSDVTLDQPKTKLAPTGHCIFVTEFNGLLHRASQALIKAYSDDDDINGIPTKCWTLLQEVVGLVSTNQDVVDACSSKMSKQNERIRCGNVHELLKTSAVSSENHAMSISDDNILISAFRELNEAAMERRVVLPFDKKRSKKMKKVNQILALYSLPSPFRHFMHQSSMLISVIDLMIAVKPNDIFENIYSRAMKDRMKSEYEQMCGQEIKSGQESFSFLLKMKQKVFDKFTGEKKTAQDAKVNLNTYEMYRVLNAITDALVGNEFDDKWREVERRSLDSASRDGSKSWTDSDFYFYHVDHRKEALNLLIFHIASETIDILLTISDGMDETLNGSVCWRDVAMKNSERAVMRIGRQVASYRLFGYDNKIFERINSGKIKKLVNGVGNDTINIAFDLYKEDENKEKLSFVEQCQVE